MALQPLISSTPGGQNTSSNITGEGRDSETEPGSPPTFDHLSIVKVSVLMPMFVFSTVANIATMYLIVRLRRVKSIMNHLLLHLITADIFVAIFCMLGESLWTILEQWYAGSFMCKLFKFSQTFSITLSTYIIVLIGVDRASVILFPMKRNRMARWIKALIIVVWVSSAMVNIPQFFVFEAVRAPWNVTFIQCIHIFVINGIGDVENGILYWFNWLMNYLFPLILIISSYSLILVKLSTASRKNIGTSARYCIASSSRQNFADAPKEAAPMEDKSLCVDKPTTREPSSTNGGPDRRSNNASSGSAPLLVVQASFKNNSQHTTNVQLASLTTCENRVHLFRRAKIKSIQISGMIVASFLVCWTPYYVAYLFGTMQEPSQRSQEQMTHIFSFGQMSSLFNPIIYGVFHYRGGSSRADGATANGYRSLAATRVTRANSNSSVGRHLKVPSGKMQVPRRSSSTSAVSEDQRSVCEFKLGVSKTLTVEIPSGKQTPM